MTVHEDEWLARRFEENRPRLRAMAYRMLGSGSDADDAVQESWLRLSRSGATGVANLSGWLTTVVARVCLDMLRSRRARREEPFGVSASGPVAGREAASRPEDEALLADSVGLALLVVLDRLAPAERLAFVLHDMFDVPFDEIAPIVGRSPGTTRQLASRARRRVHGVGSAAAAPDLARQREIAGQRQIVDAFLSAARDGDFDALLVLLDPDVVVRADADAGAGTGTGPAGAGREVRGAPAVARQALAFSGRARYARPALVNGAAGVVVAPHGRLFVVMVFTVRGGKIVEIDVVADPGRLRRLDLALLGP